MNVNRRTDIPTASARTRALRCTVERKRRPHSLLGTLVREVAAWTFAANIATVPGRSAAVLNEPAAFDQTSAVASPGENALGVGFGGAVHPRLSFYTAGAAVFVYRNSYSALYRPHSLQLLLAPDPTLQVQEGPRKRS